MNRRLAYGCAKNRICAYFLVLILFLSFFVLAVPLDASASNKDCDIAAIIQRLNNLRKDVELISDELARARAIWEIEAALDAARKAMRQRDTFFREARVDPLTGLKTLHAYREELPRLISETMRHGGRFAYLVIDINHFKSVNDTYGHQVGDFALQVIGRVLQKYLRPEDAVFRYGGGADEFIVLLKHVDAARTREVIQRLLTVFDGVSIRPRVDKNGAVVGRLEKGTDGPIRLSLSIGGVIFDAQKNAGGDTRAALTRYLGARFNWQTEDMLFQQAERQMYESKHRKPEHARLKDPSLTTDQRHPLSLIELDVE